MLWSTGPDAGNCCYFTPVTNKQSPTYLLERKKKKPDLDSSWISYPLPNLNLKPVSAADILHSYNGGNTDLHQ